MSFGPDEIHTWRFNSDGLDGSVVEGFRREARASLTQLPRFAT